MNHRTCISLIPLFALSYCLTTRCHGDDSHPLHASRPNIVVILCDDLGYGDLGCYGHPSIKTPNLDRLASEGIRFTDCYTASPVCSSARAGLLTGRNPNRSGIYDWLPNNIPVFLKTDEPTIPGHLLRAGYRTAMVGKWHLNGRFNDSTQPQPDAYGFEHWVGTQNNASPSHKHPTNFIANGKPLGKLNRFSCQAVADESIRWLREIHGQTPSGDKNGAPFYLHVCFHEPHEPVASPEALVDQYRGIARNEDETQYFANVTNMDQAVGRIVDAINQLGQRDDTLIFFTSDNGPETLKRYAGAKRSYGQTGGLRDRKLHVYEGGIRVCGIANWKRLPDPGSVYEHAIGSVDLLPTFCDLAGVPLQSTKTIDGISLLGMNQNSMPPRERPLFWFYYRSLTPPRFAVRVGDWKINCGWDGPFMQEKRNSIGRNINPDSIDAVKNSRLNTFELYDLKTDREESTDVSAEHPQRLNEMRAIAENIFRDVQQEAPRWPATRAFWKQ